MEGRRVRRGQEGMGTIPAFFLISISAFAVFLVAAMFVTGVAQRYLIPILKQKAVGLVDKVERRGPAPPVAGDSAVVAAPDSLRGLLTQIDTERARLEEEKLELRALRGSIDSVVVEFRNRQNAEAARQAVLFAKMLPEDAAQIMQALDDAALNAVLARMTPKAASRVMSKLDPARLARLAMEGIGTQALADLNVPPGAAAPAGSAPPAAGGGSQ